MIGYGYISCSTERMNVLVKIRVLIDRVCIPLLCSSGICVQLPEINNKFLKGDPSNGGTGLFMKAEL